MLFLKTTKVMVWAAVSPGGGKSPLVFSKEGTKAIYMKMLAEVLPWAIKAFGNNLHVTLLMCPMWHRRHFSRF